MHQLWNFEGMELGYKFPSGRPCATASGYGYGLRIMHDCDERFYVGHGGGLPGFGSYWRIMPDYGLGITIFGNRTYAGFSEISLQVLDTLLAVTGLKPRPVEAAPILEQRKNELVKLLPDWKGAEKSSIFAMNFFMDNSIDSLRKRTTELFTKAGKINSFSRMEPWNMLRGHFIIDGEMTDLRVVFTLSPEAEPRIQDFYITEVNE
jgi:CubicO group peptidase (beta-lactamase class C family)